MVNVQIKVPDWLDRICVWPVLVYRWWKYGYTFRRIYLGEGKYAIVDQPDYYQLKNFRWYLAGNGKELYAFRNELIAPGKTKMVGMHRQIMGFPQGLLVDHQNNFPLDNRRANLRLATQSQNMINRAKIISDKTTSKFVGVSFDKRRGKWYARIYVQKKCIWLGFFNNEIDAAKAYDKAAMKYYTEFARLNFPESADGVQRSPTTFPYGKNDVGASQRTVKTQDGGQRAEH
jgi:hypothetical protein